MSTFPGSPRLIKAGIVLLDPATAAVRGVVVLQYNPETLNRTLTPKTVSAEAGDRREALRLTGPPVENIKLEAEIDAADRLEFPDQNPNTVQFGIQPQLAALESIVYPSTGQLQAANALAGAGTLEIAPAESPLALLVFGKRSVPVLITEFSITEEAFDPQLNPILAKISLGFRVLSADDLPFEHKGNGLYLAYQQQKERLSAKGLTGGLAALGSPNIG